MAWKKPIRTPIYVKAYPGVSKRIKIPQPVTRPVDIHTKDLMKSDKDPWWYILHRKGLRRLKVGEDPLEARAISKDMVRGTLPERIVYKFLTDQLKLVSGVDFDFQSSQSGGRLELGGIVADFLFFYMKIIIQVQGPTHKDYLRGKKDDEQKSILASMGYRVFDIEELVCYNVMQLEEWMRRTFGLALGTGAAGVWSKSPGQMSGGASTMKDAEQILAAEEEEFEDETTLAEVLKSLHEITMLMR